MPGPEPADSQIFMDGEVGFPEVGRRGPQGPDVPPVSGALIVARNRTDM